MVLQKYELEKCFGPMQSNRKRFLHFIGKTHKFEDHHCQIYANLKTVLVSWPMSQTKLRGVTKMNVSNQSSPPNGFDAGPSRAGAGNQATLDYKKDVILRQIGVSVAARRDFSSAVNSIRPLWLDATRTAREQGVSSRELYASIARTIPVSPTREQRNLFFAASGQPIESRYEMHEAGVPLERIPSIDAWIERKKHDICQDDRRTLPALRASYEEMRLLGSAECVESMLLAFKILARQISTFHYADAYHSLSEIRDVWPDENLHQTNLPDVDPSIVAQVIQQKIVIIGGLQNLLNDLEESFPEKEFELREIRRWAQLARPAAVAVTPQPLQDDYSRVESVLLRLPEGMHERTRGLAELHRARREDSSQSIELLEHMLRAPAVRVALQAQDDLVQGQESHTASKSSATDDNRTPEEVISAIVAQADLDFSNEISGYSHIKTKVLDRLRLSLSSGNDSLKPLLLVGPSGTAKTKMARIMAQAMQRQFIVVSGAELGSSDSMHGAQSYWRGARPGPLTEALLSAETNRPLFILFDEVGAASTGGQEEISRILDPQHNSQIKDKYLGNLTSFDLSKAMFVLTANDSDVDNLLGRLKNRAPAVIRLGALSSHQRTQVVTKKWSELRDVNAQLPELHASGIKRLVESSATDPGARLLEEKVEALQLSCGSLLAAGIRPATISAPIVQRQVGGIWADIEQWDGSKAIVGRITMALTDAVLSGTKREKIFFEALDRVWGVWFSSTTLGLELVSGEAMEGLHGMAIHHPGGGGIKVRYFSSPHEKYNPGGNLSSWRLDDCVGGPLPARTAAEFLDLLSESHIELGVVISKEWTWKQSTAHSYLTKGLSRNVKRTNQREILF